MCLLCVYLSERGVGVREEVSECLAAAAPDTVCLSVNVFRWIVLCPFRLVVCRFERIGCPWRGPFHELPEHQTSCTHPNKSGQEIMDSLALVDQKKAEEAKLFSDVFTFLSYEKVTFSGMYGSNTSPCLWMFILTQS